MAAGQGVFGQGFGAVGGGDDRRFAPTVVAAEGDGHQVPALAVEGPLEGQGFNHYPADAEVPGRQVPAAG